MIAFELIIKYLSGKASPEEAMRIDNWIDASPSHREHFELLQASWLEAGGETMLMPDAAKHWNKISGKGTSAQTGGKVITLGRLLAAASFVGVCLLGYFLWNSSNQNSETQLAQATTDTLNIALADKSEVKIYPGSELSHPSAFEQGDRAVGLKGSAFFTITPDKTNPFVIDAGICKVQVLGTSFSVEHLGDSVVVSVSTGTVRVYNDKSEVTITEGQVAVCNALGMIYTMAKEGSPANTAAVTTGSFDFDGKPMTEVLAELSAYFKTEITIEDPKSINCAPSISFTDETLDGILSIIAETFGLTVKKEDGRFILSGSC